MLNPTPHTVTRVPHDPALEVVALGFMTLWYPALGHPCSRLLQESIGPCLRSCPVYVKAGPWDRQSILRVPTDPALKVATSGFMTLWYPASGHPCSRPSRGSLGPHLRGRHLRVHDAQPLKPFARVPRDVATKLAALGIPWYPISAPDPRDDPSRLPPQSSGQLILFRLERKLQYKRFRLPQGSGTEIRTSNKF